jgi:hypothetical protein
VPTYFPRASTGLHVCFKKCGVCRYMQSMPLKLGSVKLAFLLIMAIQICLQGRYISKCTVATSLPRPTLDRHDKGAHLLPPNKILLTFMKRVKIFVNSLINQTARPHNKQYFFSQFVFKEGKHAHKTTTVRACVRVCVCVSVRHI